jgi:hypothetical protein
LNRNLAVAKLARRIIRKKILGHRLAHRTILVFLEHFKLPNKLKAQFPFFFLTSQDAHYPCGNALTG